MGFAAVDAYDRLIGRYSELLAPRLLDLAGVREGQRVLDVGCGPGAVTALLAERLGADRVAAIDPSEPFVAACAERVPGADVRHGRAEELPWPDDSFDAAVSQLVLSFVSDAPAAAAELRRVVRPGGVAVASTFDAGGFAAARLFWDAALAVDPDAPDDDALPLRRSEELEALWRGAGFADVVVETIEVEAAYAGFEDLWQPITGGIGPMGAWYGSIDDERRAAVRDALEQLVPAREGSFALAARVLVVRGGCSPRAGSGEP